LDELRDAGFRLTEEPGEIEFVVASFDRTFEYRKLQLAFGAIRAGARFVATNADRYCPVPGGGLPDAAAVIGAIEGCTGKQVEVVVGKPSPITVRAILERLRLPASECIVVGDRLETDVRMGQEAGMATAVVLTGVTTPELLAASDIRPDYVLHGLDELLPPSHRTQAQKAVSRMREAASAKGADRMTLDEINEEIRRVRQNRSRG
jgi:ribonucleotide monophosphatase NagD (HAD superfamily)